MALVREGTLSPFELQQVQAKLNQKQILIIKFGAEWCSPCKTIKPICDKWLQTAPANIIWIDIDVDESIELYIALKSKKMINGIPVILAFRGDKSATRDQWYIPDDSIIGGDVKKVGEFLDRCLK